jgi:hypothetical protein
VQRKLYQFQYARLDLHETLYWPHWDALCGAFTSACDWSLRFPYTSKAVQTAGNIHVVIGLNSQFQLDL